MGAGHSWDQSMDGGRAAPRKPGPCPRGGWAGAGPPAEDGSRTLVGSVDAWGALLSKEARDMPARRERVQRRKRQPSVSCDLRGDVLPRKPLDTDSVILAPHQT